MRLEGAIFDLDGTLLDSMHVWDDVASDLLREMGIKPEPGLDRKVRTMGLHAGAAYCQKTYGLRQSEDEIVAMADARVDRFYQEEVTAKPEADKVLSILKMQGVWMYIATATDREQAEGALRHTGLDGYFRGIMTSTEAGCGKDDPLIFDKCLTRLRCRKEQCIVFEDSLYAIQTAKSAGYRVAAIYDEYSEKDQGEIRKLADFYIHSYGELLHGNPKIL